jgi:hypothetical protein
MVTLPTVLPSSPLVGSLQTEWETQHSFIKDMRHGHENFQGESLVGVCRHSVGELHPTSVFCMKTQYVESLVVEVDVHNKPLSRRASFFSSSPVMMTNPSEYRRAYGGADDRVEWWLLTVNSCIKVRLDLQADKSPVVVKGPFFPRVVNPRYRIRGTMCNARIQSSKARSAILWRTKLHLIY